MKTFAVALLATATQAAQWGSDARHSHYRDIIVNRPYTQDASSSKTITNNGIRQQRNLYDSTTSSIVYDDQVEQRQKDWLQDNLVNKGRQVNSTSYSTAAASNDKTVTRYDSVNADRQTSLDVFQTNQKNVGIKNFAVDEQAVTTTRQNVIGINKLRDVVKSRPVEKTILVDVASTCERQVNQPISETILVDVASTCDVQVNQPISETILVDVAATCERQVNQPISETILVDVAATCDRQVNQPISETILVDVAAMCDREVQETILVDVPSYCNVQKTVNETILVDQIKTINITNQGVHIPKSYETKTILVHGSSSDGPSDGYSSLSSDLSSDSDCYGCSSDGQGHALLTKRIPKYGRPQQVPVITQ